MTSDIVPATGAITAEVLEQVVLGGDLEKLTPRQRIEYYNRVCQSLGLNPFTRPFGYIRLNNKLTLYALREATDQLRHIHKVSTQIVARENLQGVYVVTARATMPDGRCEESIGAVAIEGLKGDNLANALMKAETKAKRRVTLSIVGLGFLDETEVETVPDARRVDVDSETGEIGGDTDALEARETRQDANPGALRQRLAAEAAPAAQDTALVRNGDSTPPEEPLGKSAKDGAEVTLVRGGANNTVFVGAGTSKPRCALHRGIVPERFEEMGKVVYRHRLSGNTWCDWEFVVEAAAAQ